MDEYELLKEESREAGQDERQVWGSWVAQVSRSSHLWETAAL